MTEVINAFPGYEFVNGHNMYRGDDLGKGGWVYAEPGMYTNVALLDVGNMHGASILALNKFGEYTKNYKEIRDARMALKHHDYDTVKNLLDGKLTKYLSNDQDADDLQAALKLVLNMTYGIAAGTFENPLRDPKDENNIIALRGALFMRTLKDELIAKGYPGIHYKTDSVKIPNATPDIIQFVIDFGRKYSYEFEHEATYDRMCLVNDAVYIAKYADVDWCQEKYGYIPGDNAKAAKKEPHMWTATGTQFKHPYVFKRLFSKEQIEFEDLCEMKSVSTALYLDMNEGKNENEHDYVFIGKNGLFCPMKDGSGGGILLREKDGKYYAATGSKGYRWLESETVKALGKENYINMDYFNKLADESIDSISEFGDFYKFVSNDPLDISKEEPNPLEKWVDINSDELPF